jgi:hypothetical protein
VYELGAIPLMDQNLAVEATEAMTRVQERERVMIAVLGLVFGVLASLALWRRGGG